MIGTVENRERGVETEPRVVRVENAQDAGMSLDDGLVLTSAERTEQTSFRRPRIRHESIKNNCFRKYNGNRELSVHYTHMSDMKTISRHLFSLISPQLKKIHSKVEILGHDKTNLCKLFVMNFKRNITLEVHRKRERNYFRKKSPKIFPVEVV